MKYILTITEIMFKTFLDVLREMWYSKFNTSNNSFEMGVDVAKYLLVGVRKSLPTWRHSNNLCPIAGKKTLKKKTKEQTDSINQ